MSLPTPLPDEDAQLLRGIAVLNARAIGVALGTVCGLGMLVATLWLVVKGGDPVGPHLALLSQFFIGYHVSLGGSVVGALYGFAVGSIAGTLLGWVYNALSLWRGRRKRAASRRP
ncbi:MAG: hypothetical protein ABIJ09_27020 [Pseudomonadota bacterium]